MYSKVYSTVQYTVLSTDLVALLAVQTQGTDSTDQVVFHLSYWQATALVLLLLLLLLLLSLLLLLLLILLHLLLLLLLPVSWTQGSPVLSRLVGVTYSGEAKLTGFSGILITICVCKQNKRKKKFIKKYLYRFCCKSLQRPGSTVCCSLLVD